MATTESQRKKNFIAYYTANPDKLKGKSVYDAYAAMRRESGRQNKNVRAADRTAGYSESAVQRRIDKLSGDKGSKKSGWNAMESKPKSKPPVGGGRTGHSGWNSMESKPSSKTVAKLARDIKNDPTNKLGKDLERLLLTKSLRNRKA